MAITGSNPAANQFDLQKLDAAKYISLYDLVNKPDNRDALIKTYGNQGITGFLQLVGATKAVAKTTKYSTGKKSACTRSKLVQWVLSVLLLQRQHCTVTGAANVILRCKTIVLVNGLSVL
jgi:hypothetical protein